MKNSLLIIAIVFIGILVQAQKPPKGTNTIILKTELSNSELLISFARHLQDEGYSIEKLDKDLLSLSTEYEDYKTPSVAVMKIDAFVRGNKIVISGDINITDALSGAVVKMDICKCGFSGDARLNAFKEMLRTIISFKYNEIEYQKK